jgi:hypothetical protein
MRNITVDVRTQATLVLALAVLWCASVIGVFSEMGTFHFWSDLWAFLFIFLPFIMPVFAGILLFYYWRAGKPHKKWVYSAVWTAAFPWILCFVIWIFSLLVWRI